MIPKHETQDNVKNPPEAPLRPCFFRVRSKMRSKSSVEPTRLQADNFFLSAHRSVKNHSKNMPSDALMAQLCVTDPVLALAPSSFRVGALVVSLHLITGTYDNDITPWLAHMHHDVRDLAARTAAAIRGGENVLPHGPRLK